jgi:hypothetical protein
MKSFTIKQIHIIWLESIRQIYEIIELINETGKIYFVYREQILCDRSLILGGPSFGSRDYSYWEFEPKNILPKATNLLGAQANLIEIIIKERCGSHLSDWVSGRYPEHLMQNLGKENLPLLLNFFDDHHAIKAFEKALKEIS